MLVFVMILPIIGSVAIMIYALIKGFDKTSLIISAGIAMVAAMFIMKYDKSWYAFVFALTVPMALTYVSLSLYLSVKENRRNSK